MATLGQRIKQIREEAGLTQEEFGKLFGIVKSTVSMYEKGKSTPDDNIKKQIADYFGISLDYLTGRTNIRNPYNEKYKAPNAKYLPILGTISAGLPLLAEENWEGTLEISDEIKADFALRVVGDSMSWVGIHEGDLALLQQTNVAHHGQIVAAGVEDVTWEATLKFYISTNNHYVLRAANPAYEDIVFTKNHRIIGTVVKIIKETPSIYTYRDFLAAKDMNDEDWIDTIEKATQYGLGPKDVAQYIEMLSKMIKHIEK